ncbi:MAG: fused MFS/spermidine synthase [Bacteroidales bacterium]
MNSRRFLPALLVLFIGSGCAALVYEVVWFQLLQLAIGSSAVSLGVLLGIYMGGLCLGSLMLPRVVSPARHPLRVYAVLELGIGVLGLIVLLAIPLVGGVYSAWAGTGIRGLLLRGVAAGICLLPPTVLMGATLPALSRWVETTPRGVSWLGFFYAGNTAGAVLGCVLAGFYLLRVYDMPTATYVAAALNAVVAALAFVVSKTAPNEVRKPSHERPAAVAGSGIVYAATAISGMTALAAEVVWTRELSLLFGGSTYTFSLILAVFLVGLALGSAVGSAMARSVSDPRSALGWCQALLCLAFAWTAYMLAASLPYWPIDPSISHDPWLNFQLDAARALWSVLPGALLWGASFPLALAAIASEGRDPGQLVGRLYASNTVGAIIGAIGTSLVLIPTIGSQHTQQALMAACAVAALLLLGTAPAREGSGDRTVRFAVILFVVGAGCATLMFRVVPEVPGMLVAYGRFAATRVGQADIIYKGEGMNSSVAVSRLANGVLNYHNAGKVQASSEPQDMRLQRMLGHLTTLIPDRPDSVLVIGCGAGVTAGAVSIDPHVKQVTIAEIEPLVVRTVSTYFSQYNFAVVRNPKVRLEIDDARHFLVTTNQKFDAITSDPLDPWVKGAAMLYTKEFFDLVKRHLNPGGAVTLFVQLYESNEEAVKSEIATFMDAFPNGVVWGNTLNGGGYDLVLLGQVEPTHINVENIEQRLRQPEYQRVLISLHEIGFSSAVDLFSTYAGRGSDLSGWLRDAAINRDKNLRLQYLAGMGLNLYQSQAIYANMLAFRRFPDGLFIAPDTTKAYLWEAMQQAR